MRRNRRWVLMVLPFALVAVTLGSIELVLWVADVAPAPQYFVRSTGADGVVLEVSEHPPRPGSVFRSTQFTARPRDGVKRVLTLGGSTTHGHPFVPPSNFSDWLGARLPRLHPGTEFEVLNLGSNGWDSAAVLELSRELHDVEAALVVLYTGHNEFLLENLAPLRTPWRSAFGEWASATRLGRWAMGQLAPPQAEAVPAEGGRNQSTIHAAPRVGAGEQQLGQQRYRAHLGEIARLWQARGAKVLVCRPQSDLRDTPPEDSSFTQTLDDGAKTKFQHELDAIGTRRTELEEIARGGSLAPTAEVESLLDRAADLAQLDPGVARVHWELGRLMMLLGENGRPLAQRAFQTARELDGHPIRCTEWLVGAVAAAAAGPRPTDQNEDDVGESPNSAAIDGSHGRATGCSAFAPEWLPSAVVWADPGVHFQAASAAGIPGQDDLFVDYCHPNLDGHRLIAQAIVETLATNGVFAATEQWQFSAEPDVATYQADMGLDTAGQAQSFADRGLFVLGTSYFDTQRSSELNEAEALFRLSVQADDQCARGHLGLAVIAVLRGEKQGALESFTRAHAADAEESRMFLTERIGVHPVMRERLEACGLTIRDGRVESGQ